MVLDGERVVGLSNSPTDAANRLEKNDGGGQEGIAGVKGGD